MQHESHCCGGQAGVGVQQGDYGRHIGAADRNDQEHAENQGDAHNQREELLRFWMQHQVNRSTDRHDEEQEVHQILSLVGNRALRQDFL